MKFWAIAFAALAIAALVALLLGYHRSLFIFIISGYISYMCFMSYSDEQKFNI